MRHLIIRPAAVGIYGVMSYAVSGRTREVGIRAGLGARAASVLRLILRRGMAPVTVGMVVGPAAAPGQPRLVQSGVKFRF